jgi:hypothetical protein
MERVSSDFQQAIEIVEALPPEDQMLLIEIIRQRLIQYRRAELLAKVAEARQAYQQGKVIQTYRTETTLSSDGTLTIAGLPFRAGDKVQVVVCDRRALTSGERYPLRGKPIRYIGPFESVAEDEWEALK